MQKAVFKGLMLALLIGLAPSVRADDDEPAGASWFPQLTGTIVSVRADVLQVRPRFSSQLTRVLINADTKLQTMQFLPIKDLTVGMRIMAMGDKIAGKPLIANMIMAPTANDGFFGGETKGIQAGGYGNSVMWGGKIKTLQPLTVTDDAGADLPVLTAPNTPVMKTVQGPANNLRVSQAIAVYGKRSADGLLLAARIELQQAPDSQSSLFGEVVKVRDREVEFRPRFAEQNVGVFIHPEAKLYRQIPIDPDTVKIGDTITAQGKYQTDRLGAKIYVAAILLIGKNSYPKVPANEMFAMFRGPESESLAMTGKVASLSPFVITREKGEDLVVIIPGQTPVADLVPIRFADLRAGDKVMCVGKDSSDGRMFSSLVIVGASAIVGLGN